MYIINFFLLTLFPQTFGVKINIKDKRLKQIRMFEEKTKGKLIIIKILSWLDLPALYE